jgi:NhaP-type Na+/H+ and K+/H+ antiporter
MIPILTLIFVVAISMFITKAATLALIHTGMSRERARFQARSAFSGAGFTTSESEVVVKHPVRRKIIMVLILLGNAGVVTVISSLILGFTGQENNTSETRNILLLVFGASLLFLATRSDRIDRFIEKMINYYLNRFTDIRPKNFSKMMTIMEDYEVSEVNISENKWLQGKSLKDLKLTEEGLLVLGIIRNDNTYIGVPRGRYQIEAEDKLIVYGKGDRVAALSKRSDALAGKQEHKESVEAHEAELDEQDAEIADSEKSE